MVIFTDFQSAVLPLNELVQQWIERYHPKAIFLREKQLTDEQYEQLARQLQLLLPNSGIDLFVCHRAELAAKLGIKNLHIGIDALSKVQNKEYFNQISVPIHTVGEVAEAQNMGCTNLVFGHIFHTECKRDFKPRGLAALTEICSAARVPVIAIGGINSVNYEDVLAAGAADFAAMSSAMTLQL